MLVGVVSDTHNNLKNTKKIITLFNEAKVSWVIHTGDICSAKTLQVFTALSCKLIGVYGNNDRNEVGLDETSRKNSFDFKEPPYLVNIGNRNIAIFHEPDLIGDFLSKNINIDVVLHGHTHRYKKEIKNGVLHFNPGESAGMLMGQNAIGILDLETLNARRIFF